MKDKNGKLYGLDIEIAKKIGERLGVSVEFDRTATSVYDLMKLLSTNKIDIAMGKLSRTFERMKYIYFSNAYAQLNQALIMNKSEIMRLKIEKNPYNYLKDHREKIGALSGTAYVEFIRSFFPKAVIIEYQDWNDVLEALQRGEIIAALYDNNEVVRLARQKPEIALTATIYVLTNKKDTIGIGIAPNSPQLLNWINMFLEINDLKLDLNKLIEKYPEVYKCD